MTDADLYWTAADSAELSVLIWDLAEPLRDHFRRGNCGECSQGGSCDAVRECVGIVIDWREARLLRSKAEWLRSAENLWNEGSLNGG